MEDCRLERVQRCLRVGRGEGGYTGASLFTNIKIYTNYIIFSPLRTPLVELDTKLRHGGCTHGSSSNPSANNSSGSKCECEPASACEPGGQREGEAMNMNQGQQMWMQTQTRSQRGEAVNSNQGQWMQTQTQTTQCTWTRRPYKQAWGDMSTGRYKCSRDSTRATCPLSLIPLLPSPSPHPPLQPSFLFLYYLNIFSHFICM